MTLGARSGLNNLYKDFWDDIKFVSVYTREAHPGENFPHHTSEEQKMRHAAEWTRRDDVPWTVAVDTLDGAIHRVYGPLPNSLYLIDPSGRVAFRAMWAGQEGLIRRRINELLDRVEDGEAYIPLDERENLVIPLMHGAVEFDRALGRAGEKAREDFKREMGGFVYSVQKAASLLGSAVHNN